MAISKNQVVTIDYTLKDTEGGVMDSSEGREPLSFIQGTGMVIPGIEDAVSDKKEGDNFQTTIEPSEGYGEYNDELIFDLPKERLQGLEDVQVGMHVQAETKEGTQILTVKEIHDDSIVFDANHPLAGQTLFFDITIKDVREATSEELEHGHIHQ
jgi:FKBP-type peptidyl-prolyl cis-trans isomerase SlyD